MKTRGFLFLLFATFVTVPSVLAWLLVVKLLVTLLLGYP